MVFVYFHFLWEGKRSVAEMNAHRWIQSMLKQSQMDLKERYIKMLKHEKLLPREDLTIHHHLTHGNVGSSLLDSSKWKHFIIFMAETLWPVFYVSLDRQEAQGTACDTPLWMCALMWCRDVWLYSQRERSAMYWSIHRVLIPTFSTICVSCHLSAISERVERMESLPPEEQKPQGTDG